MSITANVARPTLPTPATLTLAVASNLGSSLQLVATVKDGGGNTLKGHHVVWVSGTPSVGTVDNHGQFVPLTAGSTVVTASVGGVSDTCTITVT